MAQRILLVDDENDLRGIVALRLRKAGFEVEEAIHGADALEKLEKGTKPDLVILDVMMPVMDGFETCQKIRETRDHASTPILFLTARSEDWDMLTGYSKGCDNYLLKPLEFDKLLMEIKRILG
ncbi:MAG: response regulator transcription factor [Planctomycetota bacterium]